jgi:hypothetical protein
MLRSNFSRGLVLALATALSTACGDDPAGPTLAATATITVDASAATQYVAFSDGKATAVTVTEPATSTAWDLSLFTTTVAPNANAGVSAYCICSNEAASGEAVMAMTAEGQLAAFEAVTADAIPASTSFTTDAFASHRWYRYNITGSDNQIWPVYNVYLVSRGTAVYKVQLISYYSVSGAPRHITFRYAKLRD